MVERREAAHDPVPLNQESRRAGDNTTPNNVKVAEQECKPGHCSSKGTAPFVSLVPPVYPSAPAARPPAPTPLVPGSSEWSELVERAFIRQDANPDRLELIKVALACVSIVPARICFIAVVLCTYSIFLSLWLDVVMRLFPKADILPVILRGVTRMAARVLLVVIGFWRISVEGRENMGDDYEPRIFVSNHVSLVEALYFIAELCPSFVFKDAFLRTPVVGKVATRVLGSVAVDNTGVSSCKEFKGRRASAVLLERVLAMFGDNEGCGCRSLSASTCSSSSSSFTSSSSSSAASSSSSSPAAALTLLPSSSSSSSSRCCSSDGAWSRQREVREHQQYYPQQRQQQQQEEKRHQGQQWQHHHAKEGTAPKERKTPLVIFPEGTTTNGSCLIKFRTGIFVAGKPVHPVLLQFPFTTFSPAFETIPLLAFVIRLLATFSNTMRVRYLPVYTPNEEEIVTPALYASNVRTVMAKELGLPTTESTYREKMTYHAHVTKYYQTHSLGRWSLLCVVRPDLDSSGTKRPLKEGGGCEEEAVEKCANAAAAADCTAWKSEDRREDVVDHDCRDSGRDGGWVKKTN